MERSFSEATGIAYTSVGEPGGEITICLHGFPDIPATWDPLSEVLVEAGHRVVAPWLPGYAPSSLQGPHDPMTVAAKLSQLIDEIAGDDPVRLVGHDWGAVLNSLLLSQRPSRIRAAATLSVPYPLLLRDTMVEHPRQFLRSSYMAFFQIPAIPERAIRFRDFAFIDRLWGIWSPGFAPEPTHLEQVKACLASSLPGPLGYYRGMRSPKVIRAMTQALSGEPIPVPTLYLHGERDGCFAAAVCAGQERYFGSSFESLILSECGHFLHLERPDAVNQAISDWFGAH